MINFEYVNKKGETISIENYEPTTIKDSTDAYAFMYLNRLRQDLKLSQKEFLWTLEMFSSIRFSKHTTSSWITEGTMNQLSGVFMIPITNETPKDRVKYHFRLSDKGVELYNNLEALLQVEEGNEEASKAFIEGYIIWKRLS